MLTFISAVLFGYGLYIAICKIMKLPDSSYLEPMMRFKFNDKIGYFGRQEEKIYFFILKYLKIDDMRRRKLEKVLYLANINSSPEEYMASGLASSSIIIIIGLAVWVISPYVTLGAMIYSILKFLSYKKVPYEKVEENRKLIESQMYKLTSSIEQELLIDTDIIRILENFKITTNEIFQKHLETTLVEMRTSNIITALTKLEARINSTMLTDVVQGLISLSRGENNREYFSMLSNGFKTVYINEKRKEASMLPDHMSKYQALLVLAVVVVGGAMILSVAMNISF